MRGKTVVQVLLAILATIVSALGAHALASTQATLQGTRLEGVVLDQSRAPVAFAQVTLSNDTSVLARAETDRDGRFVFDNVALREARLTVNAQGFAAAEQRWSTAAHPARQSLEIILTPEPIIERVTVTATRTEARVDETAASVSLITPQQLSTTAALRLDDVLRQVAGFSLFRRSGSRTANPTTQGVSLRGVGASGASRALVLLDGVPLNDPFGGWVYWGRVPRTSLSRVEVLRGGASHLYGSGALGGVVQVITREPSWSALSLEISYGNQRTADASMFASAKRGRWAATFGAEVSHTEGYILVDKRERGLVDTPAGSRYLTVDVTLERKVAETGRLFVRGALFGESRTNGTPLQTNRTHLRQMSAGADFQTREYGSFSFRAYGGTQLFDQNFSAVSTDRATETLTRVQRVPSQALGVTAQWSRAATAHHTLVAGFEAREVRGASDELVFAQNRPSSTVGAGGRERSFGFYLEDVFRITPRLFLTGGVRVDRWREAGALSATRSLLSQPQTANVQRFPDRTETAFSPQLSVLYWPFEKMSVAASFTRAFRQPTLNELYRSFRVGDVLTLSNENLRAERLTGGEAGASFYLFNQRLVARSTFFWTEIARPVANVTLRTTPLLITRQRQNLGRTRARGLELEVESRLTTHWTLTGGYLFADATVLRFPANTALEGLAVPQVARHQSTFQVRYANSGRFTFGLQGRAAANQFDDDLNRFPLGGYFTLDAFASRHLTRRLELFAAAENLFNRRYAIGRTPVTTVGPPLLLRVGIRLVVSRQ